MLARTTAPGVLAILFGNSPLMGLLQHANRSGFAREARPIIVDFVPGNVPQVADDAVFADSLLAGGA